MNKIAVAVCDTDREYRDRFVTYLVERKAEEYAVSAFSMPEKLLEALEEEKPDLAICGTGFEEMAERLAGYDIPVLVLQETIMRHSFPCAISMHRPFSQGCRFPKKAY